MKTFTFAPNLTRGAQVNASKRLLFASNGKIGILENHLQQTTTPTAHSNPGFIASCASVGLGALAAGVIWCFASVWGRSDLDFLIVPLGIALGFFLRWQGFRGGWALGCVTFATLLAFAYAQYLFAAVRIAQTLGLPMRDALLKAGPALTASIAWGNLHIAQLTLLVVALVCGAVAVAWRFPARRSPG